MDDYGGATALADSSVFPGGVTSGTGQFNLMLLGIGGYSFGGRNKNQQTQLNIVDSLTKAVSSHTLKLGVDFRLIMPTYFRNLYSLNVTFNGIGGGAGALTSGEATNVQITSNLPAVYPIYANFSTYAQDTWRATDRTAHLWVEVGYQPSTACPARPNATGAIRRLYRRRHTEHTTLCNRLAQRSAEIRSCLSTRQHTRKATHPAPGGWVLLRRGLWRDRECV
jgi:hypothetical protein